MWTAVRKRAPEALFEGVLIVFAVLVALAVDEYNETREEHALAESAVERIGAEILDNRAEILQGRESNLALLADLGTATRALGTDDEPGIASVNYEVALLGADAWETARVTRAVQFMDFDAVTRISKVYRIQQLYQERQSQVVSDIATIGGRGFKEAFGAIRGGLAITLAMECDLIAEYDSLLVSLSPAGTGGVQERPRPQGCE